jgi:hypothetical protein
MQSREALEATAGVAVTAGVSGCADRGGTPQPQRTDFLFSTRSEYRRRARTPSGRPRYAANGRDQAPEHGFSDTLILITQVR